VTWSAVRILPGENASGRDAIVAALFARGAQAVVEDGPAIVTHFRATTDLSQIRSAVLAADPTATISEMPIADEDWSVAWRSRVQAHDAGTFTVAPPWLAEGFDPRSTIVIDPGMAFGTGDHSSTRGVLRLLPRMIHRGDVVADLGAGSAVLSIAAAKLGAARVYAIESDADAFGNATANVRINGVAELVHLVEGDAFALLPLVAPVQLILANIISSVLVELLPIMKASLTRDGRAILSGVLASEKGDFSRALAANNWRILDEWSEDDWWTVATAAV
jgi:ribosomal protein L11 methyltransferase